MTASAGSGTIGVATKAQAKILAMNRFALADLEQPVVSICKVSMIFSSSMLRDG
ncbi:hypothetical protein [Bosea sp. CRIB-10]|uniref:hypothetical protein n=1 Tax=Bosea sp. CRIB-10 TaxID=378404 RepID=UPI0015876501|nr:hypothetical protein [Bosea sp. CRIB-10]